MKIHTYGYAYDDGHRVLELRATSEVRANQRACEWAVKTGNYIMPMGRKVGT